MKSLVLGCLGFAVLAVAIGCGASSEETGTGEGQMNASTAKKPTADKPQKETGAPSTSGDAGRAKGLCGNDEQTLFQCQEVEGEFLAVCGSKELTPTKGYIQFRRGLPNEVHVRLPSDAERDNFRQLASAHTLSFSGGGGAYIRFDDGTAGDTPLWKVVYSAIGQGFEESGYASQEGRDLNWAITCEGAVESKLDSELFKAAGLPEGPESLDFALPSH